MSILNNQEMRLKEFQKQLEIRNEQLQRLDNLRKETVQMVQVRKQVATLKQSELKRLQEQQKSAIKNRDFVGLAKLSKQTRQVEKQVSSLKKLAVTSYKINNLTKQNKIVNKIIYNKIEAMAKREAMAKNIITLQIAKAKNAFMKIEVKADKMKAAWLGYKLQKQENKYEKQVSKDKNYTQATGITSSQKSNKIDISKISKNYSISKNGKYDAYKNKDTGVEVTDKGNQLSAKGGTQEEQIKSMLDIAKAKGWDLSKVEVLGNKEFKAQAQQIINKELYNKDNINNSTVVNTDKKVDIKTNHKEDIKTNHKEDNSQNQVMANLYKELQNVKAENEKLKQQVKNKEKQPSKLDIAFGKLDAMKSAEVDNSKLTQSQSQTKSNQITK